MEEKLSRLQILRQMLAYLWSGSQSCCLAEDC